MDLKPSTHLRDFKEVLPSNGQITGHEATKRDYKKRRIQLKSISNIGPQKVKSIDPSFVQNSIFESKNTSKNVTHLNRYYLKKDRVANRSLG